MASDAFNGLPGVTDITDDMWYTADLNMMMTTAKSNFLKQPD